MAKAHKPSRDELLEQTFAAREAAWARYGTVEADVLTHLINPMFMGGPHWPGTRQAYRVVRKGPVVVVASDGLSDPYGEDGPQDRNGVGLELFAATDDKVDRPGEDPVRSVGGTWLHDLVFQTAQLAASHGQLGQIVEELGSMSVEIYDVKLPASHAARFVNSAERVTVLLTLGALPIPPRIDGPLSSIRLVHLQLLTLDECDMVLAKQDAGRAKLCKLLQKQHVAPLSRLDRPSVV